MQSPPDLRPRYFRVLLTFARNSLVRDMTFRGNFVIQCITSMSWTVMNLGFYLIVFDHTNMIGADTGWGRYEFYVFLGTTWLVNSMVQAFFMPNAEEFSELIRTGNLDFALLKPIDTQFLVSFHKVDWASLVNVLLGGAVITYAVWHLTTRADDPLSIGPLTVVLYLAYVACGVTILYSLMISLSATSIWMGRNQALSNFWFYITSFSRYPMEIYNRGWGTPLFLFFTFVVPVLLVINVPARIMAQPLRPKDPWMWPLAGFCLAATLGSVLASRWIFRRALLSYRSASS